MSKVVPPYCLMLEGYIQYSIVRIHILHNMRCCSPENIQYTVHYVKVITGADPAVKAQYSTYCTVNKGTVSRKRFCHLSSIIIDFKLVLPRVKMPRLFHICTRLITICTQLDSMLILFSIVSPLYSRFICILLYTIDTDFGLSQWV